MTSEEDRVAIAVSDKGPGIPASEQQAIFGKFVRGRAAVDTHVPGTGIGLALVQRIVSAHDGVIRLDSAPGRGSTFTLLIPVLQDGGIAGLQEGLQEGLQKG
jgi:signal transduction histidine kinase